MQQSQQFSTTVDHLLGRLLSLKQRVLIGPPIADQSALHEMLLYFERRIAQKLDAAQPTRLPSHSASHPALPQSVEMIIPQQEELQPKRRGRPKKQKVADHQVIASQQKLLQVKKPTQGLITIDLRPHQSEKSQKPDKVQSKSCQQPDEQLLESPTQVQKQPKTTTEPLLPMVQDAIHLDQPQQMVEDSQPALQTGPLISHQIDASHSLNSQNNMLSNRVSVAALQPEQRKSLTQTQTQSEHSNGTGVGGGGSLITGNAMASQAEQHSPPTFANQAAHHVMTSLSNSGENGYFPATAPTTGDQDMTADDFAIPGSTPEDQDHHPHQSEATAQNPTIEEPQVPEMAVTKPAQSDLVPEAPAQMQEQKVLDKSEPSPSSSVPPQAQQPPQMPHQPQCTGQQQQQQMMGQTVIMPFYPQLMHPMMMPSPFAPPNFMMFPPQMMKQESYPMPPITQQCNTNFASMPTMNQFMPQSQPMQPQYRLQNNIQAAQSTNQSQAIQGQSMAEMQAKLACQQNQSSAQKQGSQSAPQPNLFATLSGLADVGQNDVSLQESNRESTHTPKPTRLPVSSRQQDEATVAKQTQSKRDQLPQVIEVDEYSQEKSLKQPGEKGNNMTTEQSKLTVPEESRMVADFTAFESPAYDMSMIRRSAIGASKLSLPEDEDGEESWGENPRDNSSKQSLQLELEIDQGTIEGKDKAAYQGDSQKQVEELEGSHLGQNLANDDEESKKGVTMVQQTLSKSFKKQPSSVKQENTVVTHDLTQVQLAVDSPTSPPSSDELKITNHWTQMAPCDGTEPPYESSPDDINAKQTNEDKPKSAQKGKALQKKKGTPFGHIFRPTVIKILSRLSELGGLSYQFRSFNDPSLLNVFEYVIQIISVPSEIFELASILTERYSLEKRDTQLLENIQNAFCQARDVSLLEYDRMGEKFRELVRRDNQFLPIFLLIYHFDGPQVDQFKTNSATRKIFKALQGIRSIYVCELCDIFTYDNIKSYYLHAKGCRLVKRNKMQLTCLMPAPCVFLCVFGCDIKSKIDLKAHMLSHTDQELALWRINPDPLRFIVNRQDIPDDYIVKRLDKGESEAQLKEKLKMFGVDLQSNSVREYFSWRDREQRFGKSHNMRVNPSLLLPDKVPPREQPVKPLTVEQAAKEQHFVKVKNRIMSKIDKKLAFRAVTRIRGPTRNLAPQSKATAPQSHKGAISLEEKKQEAIEDGNLEEDLTFI